jgi:hypothetical protein
MGKQKRKKKTERLVIEQWVDCVTENCRFIYKLPRWLAFT